MAIWRRALDAPGALLCSGSFWTWGGGDTQPSRPVGVAAMSLVLRYLALDGSGRQAPRRYSFRRKMDASRLETDTCGGSGIPYARCKREEETARPWTAIRYTSRLSPARSMAFASIGSDFSLKPEKRAVATAGHRITAGHWVEPPQPSWVRGVVLRSERERTVYRRGPGVRGERGRHGARAPGSDPPFRRGQYHGSISCGIRAGRRRAGLQGGRRGARRLADKVPLRDGGIAPEKHQNGAIGVADLPGPSGYPCGVRGFRSGRYWDRTSDLCRVKAALSR